MASYKNELIITIVNRGFADDVMEAAKEAGARGGTIVYAKGAGSQEGERFFGIEIQPEKELVMILAPKSKRGIIMTAIAKKSGLSSPGRGLCFSVPVEDAIGMTNMSNMLVNEEQE